MSWMTLLLNCPENPISVIYTFQGLQVFSENHHHKQYFYIIWVCVKPLISYFQGGYCIKTLSEGVALSLKALLGDPCPRVDQTKRPNDR